ncbi:MAG: thiamine pyrophosphate-dependent enzyme [Paracoccus sp. (in: a-proteobacteria)]
MTMTTYQACAVIHDLRGDAILVSTMSAMMAISAVSPSPLNISSVPLMGGASGLGLGLAITQPDRPVMVLDGDASLLMELGTLAQIADAAPKNFIHIVFNNSAQFAGIGNLDRPGGKLDFTQMALATGYVSAQSIGAADDLKAALTHALDKNGPHLLELAISSPHRFTVEGPQPELPDLQFNRMGREARAMMAELGTAR